MGHLSLVERLSSSRKFSSKPIGKSSCPLFGGSILLYFTVNRHMFIVHVYAQLPSYHFADTARFTVNTQA